MKKNNNIVFIVIFILFYICFNKKEHFSPVDFHNISLNVPHNDNFVGNSDVFFPGANVTDIQQEQQMRHFMKTKTEKQKKYENDFEPLVKEHFVEPQGYVNQSGTINDLDEQYSHLRGLYEQTDVEPAVQKLDKNLCSDLSQPYRSRVKVGCRHDDDCNTNLHGENTCDVSTNTCKCNTGTGLLCHRGKKNYPPINEMSPKQILLHKSRYHKNMTRQDYIDWLNLYRNEPHLLSPQHKKNLSYLISGQTLSERDMPKYVSSKVKEDIATSEEYFKRLYPENALSGPLWNHKLELKHVVASNYDMMQGYIQAKDFPNPVAKNYVF